MTKEQARNLPVGTIITTTKEFSNQSSAYGNYSHISNIFPIGTQFIVIDKPSPINSLVVHLWYNNQPVYNSLCNEEGPVTHGRKDGLYFISSDFIAYVEIDNSAIVY